jgi:hypothetical protein
MASLVGALRCADHTPASICLSLAFPVDMDGDMDVLAGAGSIGFVSLFQLVWCENKGGSNPEFVAHVLLGGASIATFDVLVSTDAVLVVAAVFLEWSGHRGVQLKWFRSVPGMSIARASDDLLVHGPVITGFTHLVIAPIIDDVDVDPAAFDVVVSTDDGVTWYHGDESSPSGLTASPVMMGDFRDVDVADVDGEEKSNVAFGKSLLPASHASS